MTAIAAACRQPERVVGLHFFNPAPLLPLVEIIPGLTTSAETTATSRETAAAWGNVLGMVLSATVFGFVLFVAGLKRVGPQVTSVLSTFEPLGTLMLAAVILGEKLATMQWLGAALIIGAAFVLASTGEQQVDGVGPADAPLPALSEAAGK